ncbi:MAG: hypothetical protein HZB26_10425 [Candidatus Hydrogenedentes bacterium]|nr:hypothetical protein [Candidatus Hydrogenedentota bacterium]
MRKINRRQFIQISSAAGASLVTGTALANANVLSGALSAGRDSFVDRIAFGPWMNDTRINPLPFSGWPPENFDDSTVEGLIQTFDLNQAFGYNIYDIFGLFATWGWPEDIESAATPERAARVRKVIKAAHDRNIRVIPGMGVYSWGFDEIIKNHPEVAGVNQKYPNEHVMCASKEASWTWQQRLIDFMMKWDIDGFHLEAADLGRCSCPDCMATWPNNADYYNNVTARTAQYIREKMPSAYVMLTTISWADWNTGFTEQDKNALVEISKSVDCIFDQGHHACYIRPPDRKPFIELYADGGRGVLYYQGPPNNPGVEINIAFGGQMMCNADKSVEENLSSVLERLYKPKSPAALDKLVNVVRGAEDAYFNSMEWDEKRLYLKGNKAFPGPGELHLSRPITGLYGTPDYLLEPQLTFAGRSAYNAGLEAVLKEVYAIGDQFEDDPR